MPHSRLRTLAGTSALALSVCFTLPQSACTEPAQHIPAKEQVRKPVLIAPAAAVQTVYLTDYPTTVCRKENLPGADKQFDGTLLYRCTYQAIMRWAWDLRDTEIRTKWSDTWFTPPDAKTMADRTLALKAVRAMVSSLSQIEQNKFTHLDDPPPPPMPAASAKPILLPPRSEIPVPAVSQSKPDSVEYKIIDHDTLYLRLRNFTDEDLRPKLRAALQKGVDAKVSVYVIDLSDNFGGWVYEAETLAELTMEQGLVTRTWSRDAYKVTYKLTVLTPDLWLFGNNADGFSNSVRADKALVPNTASLVLIMSSYSASASEMYAGACRSVGRCTLVGDASVGKDKQGITVNLPFGYSMYLVSGLFIPGTTQVGWSGLIVDHLVSHGSNEVLGDPAHHAALKKAIEVGRADAKNRSYEETERLRLRDARFKQYIEDHKPE